MYKYPDFWAGLLNGLSLGTLYAAMFWATVGLIMRRFFKAMKRDPLTDDSPVQFDFSYWRKDNWRSMLLTSIFSYLVVLVSIRFVKNLFGQDLTMAYAFSTGLCLDVFIAWINKFRKNGKI